MAERMANIVSGKLKSIEDSMVKLVTTGKLEISDLTNSILSDLARIAVQEQVTAPLAKMFKLTGANSSTSSLAELASLALPKFANGGNPPVGMPYIVGERGPEVRVDYQPGVIIPNGKQLWQPNAPAPVVNVTQNFTVGDVASVSLVRQAVSNAERRIAANLNRSMNYGGPLG